MYISEKYLFEFFSFKKKNTENIYNPLEDKHNEILNIWKSALNNYVDKIIKEVSKVEKTYSEDKLYEIIWENYSGSRSQLYKKYKKIYDMIYNNQLRKLISFIPKIKLKWKEYISEYENFDFSNIDKDDKLTYDELYKKYKKYLNESPKKMAINFLGFDYITGKKSGDFSSWHEEYDLPQLLIYYICDFS